MARKQERKFTSFNLDDSPVVAENERILSTPTVHQSSAPVAAPVETSAPAVQPQANLQPQQSTPSFPAMNRPSAGGRPKKTENGITIAVPMEYYERITLMKMRTGIPIRDLALQAVIEFLENHKND